MDKKSKNKNNSNVTTEEKLNRLKDSIKGTLTRLEAFTSEKTVSKDTSVTEIEIKLKKIEQLQINLDKIAEDYCEIEIFESLEIIQLDIEDINQRIETTEVGLKLLMYSLKNSENVNINLNDNGKNSIRLPQIPLPEFSGVIAEFSNFKNQFINLISNNEQLNDSQKLYYLRASLKGEAKLLESPSDSFDSLFKALEDRYENKRQLIDSHVLEIINYEKIYSESAKELRALMDCINRNIRALKVLKYEQNDLSDIILINIILQKIDKESRKQFELSLKTAEVPTFDSIMKFLEKRSAVLENITRIRSTKMIHKNTAMSTKAKSLVVNSKKITVKPCILCRNSHPLYKCIAFQNMSVECRKKFVTNNKLCKNCLRLHYGACMSKYKCTVSGCKGLHNSLLHDSAELCSAVKNQTVGERGIETISNTTRFEGQPEVAVLTYGNKCVLLNTFMIFVKSADGYRIKLRGLLDNASTICVMREDIARKLGFKFKSANQSITGINGITQSSKYSANIEISNRDYTFARNVQFSLLPKIIDAIPVSKLNISDLNIPASIELADSNFHMPGQIDILIGSELFFEILNPEQYYLQEGNVILQNTKFGYLVTGTLRQSQQQANCCLISEPSLDITVKKFFELESLPDDSKEITKSEEEIYCEEHFVSTYKRDKTGRFIVRLPIKENAETLLGYSKENAIKRLNGIWGKLNKNNTMGTLYKEFMNEYELLGHMEEIKNETLDKINYYIPHHSVYKPEKTSTPLRVVFDASAKTTSGFSLNSILLNGGIIQQDLFSIVSRFRKHEYAFSADIKKMYRQILVDPNQRDLQRIMWKTSADAPVKTYKLATVTYGTVSAPFLATRTLEDEEKAEFPDAADVIYNDSYMDDILSGESTLEGAKKLQTRLSQLLQRGGFELHKWVSNSPELLKDLSASSYVFDKEFQDAPVKTLGMLWDPKVDCLTYKDPLCVTKAKIFIQELWKIKLDWSEQLPPDAMEEWMNFYQKLAREKRAYAAVVYIKCFNESGQSQTRLLCSKSRVAPLKTLTIPRLELSAALLLSRLVKKVVPILQLSIHKIWMWTDSTIALAWIKTEPHKLKTFVSNRVAEIQALSKDYHWKHVSSKNNPADLISRGCNVDELLKNEMWFSGPDLQTDEYEDNQLFLILPTEMN
ncbi:integrase catalytic domain-containing protein [Trichonephila clavipes]|nr:integrase catalytic domain-containing protein [Trichonephila clavipes]